MLRHLAGICALVAGASADRVPASSIDHEPAKHQVRARADAAGLSGALPAGWRVNVTATELVIQREQPVRVGGHHLDNPHSGNVPIVVTSGPEITLALRYRIEPKWSERQYVAARTANAKVYAELNGLRARHRVDEIRTSKGRPLPATDDERGRLAAYEAAHTRTLARLVQLPRCTLGATSVFDGAETYSQLDLMVDPPGAMREAYAIVELVKRRCR